MMIFRQSRLGIANNSPIGVPLVAHPKDNFSAPRSLLGDRGQDRGGEFAVPPLVER
jgi:hypothetical protein